MTFIATYVPYSVQPTLQVIKIGALDLPNHVFLSFFFMLLARSNFDHYARECDFGILKRKKKKQEKSFGCVFN